VFVNVVRPTAMVLTVVPFRSLGGSSSTSRVFVIGCAGTSRVFVIGCADVSRGVITIIVIADNSTCIIEIIDTPTTHKGRFAR